MGFKRLPNGKTLVWIDYRRADGVPTHRQTTITSHKMVDIDRAKAQLREKSDAHGSLKSQEITISVLIAHYQRRRPNNGMDSYLSNIGSALGEHKPDKSFAAHWHDFVCTLEDKELAEATISKYKAAMRAVLNLAYRAGRIEAVPIRHWEVKRGEERDRILSAEEQRKLLDVLKMKAPWLYHAVYFSLMNPIRKGDLFQLNRSNFDPSKPWIHFQPRKTESRKPRPTYLVEIDDTILSWFDSLPEDCTLLFPRIENGIASHPGDFKKLWASLLNDAGIEDFRFHDLKHCAITYMLDKEYSERDLMNLGIQYTKSMIERYYHYDAEKVLRKRGLKLIAL